MAEQFLDSSEVALSGVSGCGKAVSQCVRRPVARECRRNELAQVLRRDWPVSCGVVKHVGGGDRDKPVSSSGMGTAR